MDITKQQLDDLVCRLQHLEDRQAILDCVTGYGRGLDRLDPDFIRNAFHPGGIDDHGAFVGTAEEFVPWAIECEAGFKLTHHGISSHSCEIDGAVAHAESYIIFFVLFHDKPMVGAGGGRYIDQLMKRDGKWGITIRRFVMDWTYEVPGSDWLGPEWSAAAPLRDKHDLTYQRPLQAPGA